MTELHVRRSPNGAWENDSRIYHITDNGWEDYLAIVRYVDGYWVAADNLDGGLGDGNGGCYFFDGEWPSQSRIQRLVDDLEKKLNEKYVPKFTEEKHINERGGTQTKLPVRLDLVPAGTLLKTAMVLAEGAEKYGDWNWTAIDTDDHLNHALTHIYRFLDGDRSEPHLVHAICRLMFADYVNTNGEDND